MKDEALKLTFLEAKHSAMMTHTAEGNPVVCMGPQVWKQLREAIEAALAQDETSSSRVAKRPWVGLTDDEIDDIYRQHQSRLEHQVPIWPYERGLEAKLKEKNK